MIKTKLLHQGAYVLLGKTMNICDSKSHRKNKVGYENGKRMGVGASFAVVFQVERSGKASDDMTLK